MTTSHNSPRNNVIFGVTLVLLHIATSLIYGFCISNTQSYINISSIVIAIGMALLTIAGTPTPTQDLDLFSPT